MSAGRGNPGLIGPIWALLGFWLMSALVLADTLAPVRLVLTEPGRGPSAVWGAGVAGGLVGLSIMAAILAPRYLRRYNIAWGLAGTIPAITAVIGAGWSATTARALEISAFKPDEVRTESFYNSLVETPATPQFFLHAAALKNCKPFAWSYGEMRFYPLPANVAINVLPVEWIRRCNLESEVR